MTVSWSRIRELGRRHLWGIVAGVVVVVAVHFGALETAEYWSLAKLFELRGTREPTLPVVIVTVDESTFQELDMQWPFPRAMHGQLLMKIAEDKPLAIGMDIMFDTPSSRGPQDDEALGAAITYAGNVILGEAVTDDSTPFYTRLQRNSPIPVVRDGAAAVATLNMPADPDSYV